MGKRTQSTDDASPRFYQGAEIVQVNPERYQVKCRIPGAGIESPWLRLLYPSCSPELGYFGMPYLGDKGLVVLNQEANKGVWLGATWNDARRSPYPEDPERWGWLHEDTSEDYYDAPGKLRFQKSAGDWKTEVEQGYHRSAAETATETTGEATHDAGVAYRVTAPLIALSDTAGASITLSGGQVIISNAAGQQWIMGGGGSNAVWSCDAGGALIDWQNVGGFTLNGSQVTTMGHRHPHPEGTTGTPLDPGYTFTVSP